ncbi:hypothetical protein [Alicyclobacillus kakegawensis]|uniref:hypothetical protein n=1 Tax=Alicyclobacillus kakegawensis TaxID=392012 RepID=UPI00082BD0CC|nr:hypothetical protein [Alicyclobacillus kakegawensis]
MGKRRKKPAPQNADVVDKPDEAWDRMEDAKSFSRQRGPHRAATARTADAGSASVRDTLSPQVVEKLERLRREAEQQAAATQSKLQRRRPSATAGGAGRKPGEAGADEALAEAEPTFAELFDPQPESEEPSFAELLRESRLDWRKFK